ncbi:RagB/SusD family nutrient uptake outer membrane protein [Capnocytophaga felis]|nr:RagB/SusD family nutrient uptake outer membrane protein [Capnocytophaga felis]
MKNICKIMMLSAVFGVFSACQLDETPKDHISDADFWKSANDMRLYVNNFYNNYLPSDIQTYFSVGPYTKDADEGSDNMIKVDYDRDILNGERTLPASDGNWSWGSIRNVNYFLGNYQKATVNFDSYKKYVGEAYFFKSMLYFSMLKKYGDLPWYEKALTTQDKDELYKERESRYEIAHKIIADLNKAIEYLPTKAEGEAFRINKEIAQLLKARIALYEGTWEKYHAGTVFGVAGKDGSDFLKLAADAADAVINSGAYSLDNVGVENGYWLLFNQTDYTSSKEVMLWRKYSPSDGLYTFWSRYSRLGLGKGFTKSLIDSYLCTDGKPISSSNLYKGDMNLVNVVTNRDPRLNQTMQVNDDKHFITHNSTPPNKFKYPAFYGPNEDKCVTGYQLYKGHNTDQTQQEIGKGSVGYIYFRYAEALLISAEAKAELGTITQSDVDNTINKLRKRVGMPDLNLNAIDKDTNWQFPTLSPIINEVRRERRVELAIEGYRHDDIWRWAAADELIVGWKPKGAKKSQFQSFINADFTQQIYNALLEDADGYIDPYQKTLPSGYQFKLGRDYLLPIPTDQITLNPKLKQNPGW